VIVPPDTTIEPVRVTVALAVTAPARVAPLTTGVVNILFVKVCESIVPTTLEELEIP
jgi:hypothetical protein